MMNLNALFDRCKIALVSRGGAADTSVTDIVIDSRSVVPGTLYAAIPGTKVHGDDFIADAVKRGAAAVMSENPHPEIEIPWVQTVNIRSAVGNLGKALWGFEQEKSVVAAVTGTNGKTTVAHLLEGLFSSIFPPDDVWMFGTIDYHVGSSRIEASRTTPEALDIFRHVGGAGKQPSALVMEVSSHSLALDRVGGIEFDLAIFTNLTQDHLDFHHNMESYFQAKKRLFSEYLKKNGVAVINIDDQYGRRICEASLPKKVVTYGRADDADVQIVSWKCDWDGCSIDVMVRETPFSFSSRLRGFFNIYNMTALVAAAAGLGYDMSEVQKAFDRVGIVNGRMERIAVDMPFTVVVDYAHTPDAIDNALKTAREMTRGRLLCVFGCGGDRDRTKRPLMGAAVAACCDEAWVTSDNPRSENPLKIIDDIVNGIPLDFPFQADPDRRSAISAALRACRKGDCLVIAGKGHETYQDIAGVKHHFDDKEVVIEICDSLRMEKNHHVA